VSLSLLKSIPLACGAALLLVAGCDGMSGTDAAIAALRAQVANVKTLEFTTWGTIPSNPPPSVSVTVSDSALAQAACDATLALPVMPSGTYDCPADFGVTYQLTFLNGYAKGPSAVMTATIDPDGCQQVQVTNGSASATLWTATSPDYWSSLATDLGIAESEIFPYSPP